MKVEVYTNYRRLKEQAVSDYNELKSFGSNHDKEIGLCARGKKHYVPCYNVAGNVLAGFKDGEEFDWHCEGLSRDEMYCLFRAPRDYRSPLSWPIGRDVRHKFSSGIITVTKLSSDTGFMIKMECF